VVVIALLGYLVAGLGVLPSAALLSKWGILPALDGSSAFPCQHDACGCMSAEACWSGCCCFTLQERLEWAGARGAFIPSWARAGAADEARTHGCCSEKASGKSEGGGRVMSGLSCHGDQAWLFTGVPPAPRQSEHGLVLAAGAAPREWAHAPPCSQASIDAPVPPPRAPRA
jgi:hypothetical protein